MEKKNKKGYLITIIITVAALVLMVVFSVTSFYFYAVSDMQALGKSSLALECDELESYLEKGLDVLQVTSISIEHMMQEGAKSEDILNMITEQADRYLNEIDASFTGIYGLFNGEYLDGIGWVPDEGYDPRSRDWYKAAVEADGKTVIVPPYLDAQTGDIIISVSRLLYDKDSVISLDIVLDQVQIITENINMNEKGYGFIVDETGLVVAHSDSGERGKNYSENGEALLANVSQNAGHPFEMKVNGEKCTVFSDIVMDDWYVVMIVQNSKLYSSIKNIIIRDIVVCMVVLILIIVFCTSNFRKLTWHMEKLDESKRDMERLSDTVMQMLARTIDAKDRYTNGHSRRVAEYSIELARRMGKSEQEQRNIYYAGLLHDVGKIHIPDTIINKTEKLTDEEYSYIKLHPVSGYHILKDMKEYPMIAQSAKWHHERYDGKGYPNGLEGKNIPEVARIIGVADTYDAMASKRSYRDIMPQKIIRQEIEKGIGTQFDPEIAGIMLQMIDEDTDYQLCQKNDVNKNILVVDDEKMNQKLVEKILKEESQYTVYMCSSGMEALDMLRQQEMDIVLLDILMPEMDGFETYEKLREITDAPVVFLTADKDISTISRANEIGVDEYLVKPFMPLVLKETIYSILKG